VEKPLLNQKKEDLFAPAPATDNLEDEDGLVYSLRKTTPRGEKDAEAEGLLKLATISCEAGRMEEAGASLKSYLELLKELGQKPSSDVLHLAEKLGVPLDSTLNPELALKTDETKTDTEKELGKNIQEEPEQTNYESVMNGIVKTLEEKDSYEEALPLLKDLLNYNRQRVNISAMDPLYERIERAHSTMENDEELVATYKEHLAIKQQLDDIEGELHLLDLISAHYTNIGDLTASKRYQSEILRVKDGLEYKHSMEE
jgi:tetratricopeptide (TPR) repeat protein